MSICKGMEGEELKTPSIDDFRICQQKWGASSYKGEENWDFFLKWEQKGILFVCIIGMIQHKDELWWYLPLDSDLFSHWVFY